MGMLDKIKPNKVEVNVLKYKHLIAGRPKAGKTTLFAKVVEKKYDGDMSKGLLVAFEKGYQALKDVHAIDIEEWEDFIDLVDELVDTKDENSYEVIALDTIDVLIKRATSYVLQKAGIKDKKKYDALADMSWGAGYELLDTAIAEQIDKLDHAGYHLFFLTHDKDKTVKQKDGLEYDKTVISAGGRAGEYFKNSADMIHFIDLTKEVEKGKKIDKRYIYFRGDGDLEAGSRFPKIVKRVEYSVDNFINAIEDAIRAEYDGDEGKVEEARKQEEAKEVEEESKDVEEKPVEDSEEEMKKLKIQIKTEAKKLSEDSRKEVMDKWKEEFGTKDYRRLKTVEDLNKALSYI